MLTVVTPAASYDLTNLATVKSELGITDTASDVALARRIRQASDAIAAYTGQVWARETVQQTERLGQPWEWLTLERPLDPAIVSVAEDGVAVDPTGYELDGARLMRLNGDFSSAWTGYRVSIVYQAGFVLLGSLPWDVERAAVLTVTAWHIGQARDPMLRSETAEGVGTLSYMTTGVDASGLPPLAIGLLQPYRKLWS